MIWLFTVLLALFGFWFVDIPGLLLGGLLGTWIDRRLALPNWRALGQVFRGRAPAYGLEHSQFMLLGYLAKLSGRVLPAHIQQTRMEMQRQQLEGYRYQAAIAAFNQGKGVQLAEVRGSLQAHFKATLAAEQLLLSAWRVVWSERKVSRQQYQALKQCAHWLGVSTERLLQLEQQARPHSKPPNPMRAKLSERDQALRQLGLKPPVQDFTVVRSAYRKLLSEHHPDRLIGAGASAADIKRANETTQGLHEAYALLRQFYRQR